MQIAPHRPLSFAHLAEVLAAAHSYCAFREGGDYVLPDAHRLDEAFRDAHFGEPQTTYLIAAIGWADAHLEALYGKRAAPPPPARWLLDALGVEPPIRLPDWFPRQTAASEAAPVEAASPPAPTAEKKPRAKKPIDPDELARLRAEVGRLSGEIRGLERERDAAREEVERLRAELEDARSIPVEPSTGWQPHRTFAEGAELVRVELRRVETLLASVTPAEGGGWWWATGDGDEGRAKSEERARALAAFAVGGVE